MERIRVKVSGQVVTLLGSCQGLEGEAERTAASIEEIGPGTVALGLDPELTAHVHELGPGHEASVEDAAYMRGLSRWGQVELPPPVYTAAIETARKIDAEITGVDLSEEAYLDRFTASVGILDLTKRALKARWMKTKPPSADDPASFCRRFDAALNKGPFRELERAREHEIGRRLLELAEEGSVACVLEVQRIDGVEAVLRAPSDARAPGNPERRPL